MLRARLQRVRQRIAERCPPLLRPAISGQHPPGPRGPLSNISRMVGSELDFFADCRRYGDVVMFYFGPVPCYIFYQPSAIEEVLLTRADGFIKDASTRMLSEVLGNGLLVSEGDFWRRQRKLAAPPLRRGQIANYASQMVAFASKIQADLGDSSRVDIHAVMMQLTLEIVVKTLFDLDLGDGGEEITEAIGTAIEQLQASNRAYLRSMLGGVIPMTREFMQARDRLRGTVDAMIERRRQNLGDDLLSRLLAARDEDGKPMEIGQLRDEAVTMFSAGHETTALALTFAFILLAEHPGVYAQLVAELDNVLAGEPPTLETLPQLRYTEAVVLETMRLYPPAWAIGREALRDCEVAGVPIPKGAQLYFAQLHTQRDPRWFPHPETFDPGRWLDGLEQQLPRFAYFPFGGGARICIGNHFARMEAILVLATLAQNLRFEPEAKLRDIPLQGRVTLRPRGPVMATVRRRLPASM